MADVDRPRSAQAGFTCSFDLLRESLHKDFCHILHQSKSIANKYPYQKKPQEDFRSIGFVDDLFLYAHGKGKNKRQKRRGDGAATSQALLRLPVDLQNLVYAKTVEAGAAACKDVSGTCKDLSDIYNSTRVASAKTRLLDGQTAVTPSRPTVQAFGGSLKAWFGSKSCLELFGTFLSTAQVVLTAVDVICNSSELEKIGIRIAEDVEAQVDLSAPPTFSERIRLWAKHHIKGIPNAQKCQHFFLYTTQTQSGMLIHRSFGEESTAESADRHVGELGRTRDLYEVFQVTSQKASQRVSQTSAVRVSSAHSGISADAHQKCPEISGPGHAGHPR